MFDEMSLRKKQGPIENLKTEMGNGKHRKWKITFHWPHPLKKPFPKEFTCPISQSLMADPVIVSSGQTLDRNCALICKKVGFFPIFPDGSVSDFSNIIPNLSLKTAIGNWCKTHLVETPKPIDPLSAEKLVRKLMASQNHPETELTRLSQLSSSLVESVAVTSAPPTPLPLTIRPSCLSSSSSSDTETINPNSEEFGDLISRLSSIQVSEQEEVLISLRKITRTREETRARLCTPQLLSALRSLIVSRYTNVQVNAVACLVNLSLEDHNKVKILRSGIIPPLINALKGGSPEAQDHAAGALFSLALDDHNKTAIGVLGALQPLLHCLRSQSERAQHDSALALCHLSLVQSNRTKLIKLGSVNILLGMVKTGHLTSKIMLVLCNLALGSDGRDAMLDGGGVELFVGMLSRGESVSVSTRESCLVALYRLSYGGLRFRGLAKAVKAEEALEKAEKRESEKGREKIRKVLEVLQRKDEEEEEVDWEELLKSDDG